jgi:hypothetical protein
MHPDTIMTAGFWLAVFGMVASVLILTRRAIRKANIDKGNW